MNDMTFQLYREVEDEQKPLGEEEKSGRRQKEYLKWEKEDNSEVLLMLAVLAVKELNQVRIR